MSDAILAVFVDVQTNMDLLQIDGASMYGFSHLCAKHLPCRELWALRGVSFVLGTTDAVER